jgi:hypothetical protein
MPLIRAKLIGKDAAVLVRELKSHSAGAKDRVLRAIGNGLRDDFREITSNWKHKPTFVIARSPAQVSVFTVDDVFGYVDKGTKAHIIKAKKGKLLKFRTGYKAKTRPNNSRFKGPGKATGGWRSAKRVKHPGTKARNFSRILANRWSKEGVKLLRAELRKRK